MPVSIKLGQLDNDKMHIYVISYNEYIKRVSKCLVLVHILVLNIIQYLVLDKNTVKLVTCVYDYDRYYKIRYIVLLIKIWSLKYVLNNGQN